MGVINVGALFKVEKFELGQDVANVDKNCLADTNNSDETEDLQMRAVQQHFVHTLVSQLPAPVKN